MSSIGRTLTVWLLATLAVLMAFAGIAMFLGIRAALTAQFDDTLRARLVTLQAAARWDGEKVDLDYTDDAMPWYRAGKEPEYFAIRSVGPGANPTPSKVVARSASLGDADWNTPQMADGSAADARLPDGRRGRVAERQFRPPPEEELDLPGKEAQRASIVATAPLVSVTVGMSREPLDSTLKTVGIAIVFAGLVIAFGLVTSVRVALARGLAPLRSMSGQVQRIGAESLSSRLIGGQIPEELGPIHDRLNELLERLEAAFAREKRFTSAAAHELRTPVAELRALLEVSLSRARSIEESRTMAEEALSITLRAEGLVRALLAMARPSGASESARLSPLDISAVMVEVTKRFAHEAQKRGGQIRCGILDQINVRADRASLESILTNVLANAVEYSQPHPSITCEVLRREDGAVMVSVDNPVDDAVRTDLDRFFEPFWRSSGSRTDRTHLGMGLAISRDLAERMGGQLDVQPHGSNEVRVRLVLSESVTAPESAGRPL